MSALSLRLLTFLGLTVILWSCKDVKEDLQVVSVADYLPLQPGKYITYRLDSTVFTEQGRNSEIHYYDEKHVIDAQFLDNEGRPSYRVFRYLRDTSGLKQWTSAGTYMITPLANSIEVVEDNMRVVKLVTPVRKGYTWRGNQFLPHEPYASKYSFNNDNFMDRWEFVYESTSDTFLYNQQIIPDVLKVVQADERAKIDTVFVAGNTANIPLDAETAWLDGNASGTITINALPPTLGNEQLTIYNQTNAEARLDTIRIPAKKALYFQYANGRWFYPNPLTVQNNAVLLPSNTSLAYLYGSPTSDITIDARQLDTLQTKQVTIYNKTNQKAYATFHADVSSPDVHTFAIRPGYGRTYELYRKQWRIEDGLDNEFTEDQYITDLPYTTTSRSVEKYAKGIGMVYQELLMWEYQPNTGGTAYKIGFGVKRTMIDHN